MIQDELYGIRFLDLFAGSGAIGIEGVEQRGKGAVFVEKNDRRAVVCCIRRTWPGWTGLLLAVRCFLHGSSET